MTTRKRAVAIGIPATFIVAVFYWIERPMPTIDLADIAGLEAFADRFWEVAPSRSRAIYLDDKREWPSEVHRLAPESVRMDSRGIHIKRGKFFVTSWGWFILPRGSSFRPRSTGDPSYRRIAGRVYSYKIEG